MFAKGHRLRLEISSSNFPRYARNQNTGLPLGTSAEIKTATQTIFHDAQHPSHLLLPLIPIARPARILFRGWIVGPLQPSRLGHGTFDDKCDSVFRASWKEGVLVATAERIQTDGIRLTPAERRIWSDIDWAEHDDEIRANYAGEWIAIVNRTIVAHGTDRDGVVRAAVVAAHQPEDAIAVWSVAPFAAFVADRSSDELVF